MDLTKQIPLFLLFLSFNTYADITGIWTGRGSGQTHSRDFECQDIEVRFHVNYSERILTFRGGHYNCTNMSAEYPYSRFKIHGEDLFQYGSKVGSLSKNYLRLESAEDGYTLEIKKIDNSMELTEQWLEGEKFMTIKGELTKR